jgi:hypothetical protein
MTLRHLTLGGAAAIALGGLVLSGLANAAPQPAAIATAPARATLSLDKINRPGPALTKLAVVDARGTNIGTVVDVVTRSDGKAISLTVDTSGLHGGKRHWVGINATQLGLDQTRRVLVTNLTSAQVKALPSLL